MFQVWAADCGLLTGFFRKLAHTCRANILLKITKIYFKIDILNKKILPKINKIHKKISRKQKARQFLLE
jgi:hypothetical protein